MLSSMKRLNLIAVGLCMAATGGCSQEPSVPLKTLSPEASLECAAMLFAVNNMIEVDSSDPDALAVKDRALAGLTHFGTIYGEAKGLSGTEVLGVAKLHAYRALGKIPGGEVLSEGAVVMRAKDCLAPESAEGEAEDDPFAAK